MQYRMPFLFMAALLLGVSAMAASPDQAREQRMADEIQDMILDGESVRLRADNQSFLGIFTEAENARGSVLLLHGRGFHPDWPTLIQPLRVGLVEQGWNTLSIQMPVLENGAKYLDYVTIFPHASERIEAALAFLQERGPGITVVLAHSCGSHMAQHWMLHQGEQAMQQFDAYVGLGMGATDYAQKMVEPFALDRMKMPVLDVYAEDDFRAVRRMAQQRLEMIRQAGNPHSRQQMVAGADHYYRGKEDILLALIAEWLNGL